MKKVLSIVISLVMIMTFIAACSKNDNSSPSSSASNSSPNTANNSDVKELSFEVMIPKFSVDPKDTLIQKEWEKEMESYLGVKLNITWNRLQWGDEYFQKSKLALSTGEMPDIMLALGKDQIDQYGMEGLFADLTPYVQEGQNYKSFIDATGDAEKYLYSGDNKIYAFFDGYNNPMDLQPSQYNAAYRLDIFEKNGIKIPTTVDEFYDAAKKLKELYPDVYPVGVSENYLAYNGFYNSFHAHEGVYYNGDKFVFGPAEENFKDAVQFMNKLFSEKLLDPAFGVDGIDQARPKATTGKTFMYPAMWSGFIAEFNTNTQASGKWTNALFPSSKYGVAWQQGAEPKGKGLSNGSGLVISAKAKHPELLAKLVDYQYSEKMMNLMNWGIEGETYVVNGDKKELAPNILNAENIYAEMDKLGLGTTGGSRSGIVWTPQDKLAKYTDPGSVTTFYHDGKAEEISYWVANGTYAKDSINPNDFAPRILFSKEENETKAAISTAIDTYVKESIANFITGKMKLSDWDKFQDKLNKMGVESLLKMHNDKIGK
jgi:putative aldouronate transport system substrate-binding protein